MTEYTVIFEWTGNNYSAYVPDLPGCITMGDNFQQAQSMAKEVLGLHLWGMEKDGDNILEPLEKQ